MPQPTPLPAAWPALPTELDGVAVTPADRARYPYLSSSYMRVGTPDLILMARDVDDAAAAVGYAAGLRAAVGQVPFSVRSGGHGISGASTNDGGVVLDLSALNRVEVLGADLVRVQAGAIWGDVAAELSGHGLVITSGNMGDTGVGGLATAGGIGYFVRAHGLTLDLIRRATIVTADGAVHVVDAEHEPDLFWALRGGGTQAGVVVDLDLEARRIGEDDVVVIHQASQQIVDDLPGYVHAWGDLMRGAPREFTSFLMLQRLPDGRHLSVARNVWADTDIAAAQPAVSDFARLAPLVQHDASLMPYSGIVPTPRSPKVGQQHIQMRDALVDVADRALGERVAEALRHDVASLVELRSLGGIVADLPAPATAFAHRHQEVLVSLWAQPRGIAAIDRAWEPVEAVASGVYSAYTSDTRARQAELAWPGETGRRLRAISERVDPALLFDAGLTLRASAE